MRIILMFISVSLLSISCTNSPKDRVAKPLQRHEEMYIYGDKINRLPVEYDIAGDKSKLVRWLSDNYFEGKTIEVSSAETSEDAEIFKIEILGNIGTNVPRHYTFINASKKSSYLVPVEFNKLITVANKIMLAGIYNYREYDYFFIYSVNDGEGLKLIFDSRKINKDGLKIGYYRDDDCREYQPNRLVINYDGKTSISLQGVVKKFCKFGGDRAPQQNLPISIEKVFIRLNYNGTSWVYNIKSNYQFW